MRFVFRAGYPFLFCLTLLSSFSFANETLRIPKGRYRGQIADLSFGQNIEILQEGSRYLIENFFHSGRYWRASIPQTPSKVYVLVVDTDSKYKHVGMAFEFPSRVILEDALSKKSLELMVMDGVAIGPVGFEWDDFDAVVGNYLFHKRSISMESFLNEAGAKQVCLHELQSSASSRAEILRSALWSSHSNPKDNMFQLMSNNCGQELSRVLGIREPSFFEVPKYSEDPVKWLQSKVAFVAAGPSCL